MATAGYTTGIKELLDGTITFSSATIKLMLIASDTAYTYNPDHLYVDESGAADPIDCELNCTGYDPGFSGTGRATLGSKTITVDSTNNLVKIDAADPAAWTSLATGKTVVAAIIYNHVTSDAASRLLIYVDFTDTPTNGGSFTLNFHADGILTVNM